MDANAKAGVVEGSYLLAGEDISSAFVNMLALPLPFFLTNLISYLG